MKMELCVPCGLRLSGEKEIRVTSNRRGKITCAKCGRRKYGNEYEVPQEAETEKEPEHENNA